MFEDSQPSSHWRTYLDILPHTLNTPVFWTDSQLGLLKGSSILTRIGAKQIEKDYKKVIVPLLTRAELYTVSEAEIPAIRDKYFSFAQYRRFGSLIMAYSFTYDDGSIAMVPMADMLNHRTGYNNARLYFDQEDDTLASPEKQQERTEGEHTPKKAKKSENTFLHMRTRRNINAEEELYNTYGTLPDSELLRKYGYVEELGANRWNEIEFFVATDVLPQFAKHCGWPAEDIKRRQQFIKTNGLVDPEAVLIFHGNQEETFGAFDPLEEDDAIQGGLTRDIIALAKIFAAEPEDWKAAEKAILESKKQKSEHESHSDSDESEEEEVEEEEAKASGEVHPEGEHQEAPKRGGDLIVVQNKAKLVHILSETIQAKIDTYGPSCVEESTARLNALPMLGSSDCNVDAMRTRAALILKLGELAILRALKEEALAL